jgi:hypothetical protein
MKALFSYPVQLIFILIVCISSCSKEDDISATYKKICCEWVVTNIQFDVTIGGQDFVDFLIDFYDLTEEEAQAVFEENENAYRESWTGTMHFKQDGTYEFNVGGEYHSNNWYLSEDEKTIHVFFKGYYVDFDIVSVDEQMMRLRFDQIYYVDINEDGNKEAIAYMNDFTLEK